jgi:hypothetical protein
MYHFLSSKGAKNSSKSGQNGMKYYHSLEILTSKLQNKFQFVMWKKNEIISRKPRTDGWTDGKTDGRAYNYHGPWSSVGDTIGETIFTGTYVGNIFKISFSQDPMGQKRSNLYKHFHT